jgi:hypothetical protein
MPRKKELKDIDWHLPDSLPLDKLGNAFVWEYLREFVNSEMGNQHLEVLKELKKANRLPNVYPLSATGWPSRSYFATHRDYCDPQLFVRPTSRCSSSTDATLEIYKEYEKLSGSSGTLGAETTDWAALLIQPEAKTKKLMNDTWMALCQAHYPELPRIFGITHKLLYGEPESPGLSLAQIDLSIPEKKKNKSRGGGMNPSKLLSGRIRGLGAYRLIQYHGTIPDAFSGMSNAKKPQLYTNLDSFRRSAQQAGHLVSRMGEVLDYTKLESIALAARAR